MKKHIPVKAVSRILKGREVQIEVFHSRYGYHGKWTCASLGTSGASSTFHETVEQAILVNASNAFGGITE
jgi:hypothetical protein